MTDNNIDYEKEYSELCKNFRQYSDQFLVLEKALRKKHKLGKKRYIVNGEDILTDLVALSERCSNNIDKLWYRLDILTRDTIPEICIPARANEILAMRSEIDAETKKLNALIKDIDELKPEATKHSKFQDIILYADDLRAYRALRDDIKIKLAEIENM